MRVTRRTALQIVGATSMAACLPEGPSSPDAGPVACAEPSSASDPGYCLMEPRLVRVPAAARLAVGEAVLLNVDDNTGVIVARDAGGLHALSAICTHACCLVSLCGNAACSSLSVSPGACETTDVAEGDAESASILCPCHGSTFRLSDGAALTPPATTSLPAYSMTIDGDDVIVDTATRVEPTLRV